MSIQILVVDDHQIVREGVRSLLQSFRPEWSTLEAENANQAMQTIQNQKPNLHNGYYYARHQWAGVGIKAPQDRI